MTKISVIKKFIFNYLDPIFNFYLELIQINLFSNGQDFTFALLF